jgi:hypothetical protein
MNNAPKSARLQISDNSFATLHISEVSDEWLGNPLKSIEIK